MSDVVAVTPAMRDAVSVHNIYVNCVRCTAYTNAPASTVPVAPGTPGVTVPAAPVVMEANIGSVDQLQ